MSDEPICKRHKWMVLREFRAEKQVGPGSTRPGTWQVLICKKCPCKTGRWRKP